MISAASWIPTKSSGIRNLAPSATVDGFNVRGLTATTAPGPRSGYSALVCVCVCVPRLGCRSASSVLQLVPRFRRPRSVVLWAWLLVVYGRSLICVRQQFGCIAQYAYLLMNKTIARRRRHSPVVIEDCLCCSEVESLQKCVCVHGWVLAEESVLTAWVLTEEYVYWLIANRRVKNVQLETNCCSKLLEWSDWLKHSPFYIKFIHLIPWERK